MDYFTRRWTTWLSVALWVVLTGSMFFQTLGGTPVTFGIFRNSRGFVEYEWPLAILLLNMLLLVMLIGFRILALMLTSCDGSGTWADAFSLSLYMCGLIGLVLQGGTIGLWLFFADHPAATHFWPPIAFLVLSAVAWYLGRSDYSFGLIGDAHRSARSTSPAHPAGWSDGDAPPQDVARKQTPRRTLASIHGNAYIKRRLLDAGRAILQRRESGKDPRNGILLHGEPGNGKTIFAEALAGELGLPLFTLTFTDVEHYHVGVKTVMVKAAFDQAIRNQPCVLFIDEVDSFIASRTHAISQTKEDVDLVSGLLTLLVGIRRHRVLLVAATNHLERLDTAAIREGRFDFKIEITPPDEAARIGLLESGLKANLPQMPVSRETVASVAQRWNGYSVKRILAVTEELPSYLEELRSQGQGRPELGYDDFMAALRRLQGRAASATLPEHVKPMSDLRLAPSTREALNGIAKQILDPLRMERLGGSVPSGALFYGPPGTGKTTAAIALAKESGWSFLSSAGADLARDAQALDKLLAKGRELRPAIIFIDEADALLRSRDYSPNPDATDKLLALMDGSGGKIKDLIWIAATNQADQVDPALRRGGRFTLKVEFKRPDAAQLTEHIASWLAVRRVRLDSGLRAADIAALLDDESIANAEAVLQHAVNRAISLTSGDDIVVSRNDLAAGVDAVLGS